MEMAEIFLTIQQPTTRLAPTDVDTKENCPEKKYIPKPKKINFRHNNPWQLVYIRRGHRLRRGNTCRTVLRPALPTLSTVPSTSQTQSVAEW
jgi:hypothetical protein